MRVIPYGVYSPKDGQLVDASELNRVFSYSLDTLEDVSQKRYSKIVLPLQFVSSVSSGYDNTTPLETRTYRFSAPWDCTVETAQLFGHLTTSSGVRIDVTVTGTGLAPAGMSNPLVAVGVTTDVTQRQSVFSVNRWTMIAGQEYQFVLSGASFTVARLDLNLNLSVDRWAGTTPSATVKVFSDADAPDAVAVAGNLASLDAAAAGFATAPGRDCVMLVRHGVSSASSANIMRIELPRGESSRLTSRIVRVQVWCSMASTAGTTVAAGLWTSGGTQLASATANVAGLLAGYADSGVISIGMTSGAGVTTVPANDYSVRIACGNTTVVNKVYALVWFEW